MSLFAPWVYILTETYRTLRLGVGMAIFMIQRNYDQAVEKAKEGLLLAKDAAAEEVAFEYLGLAMSARRAQRDESEPQENPEELRISGLLKQMSSQVPHEVPLSLQNITQPLFENSLNVGARRTRRCHARRSQQGVPPFGKTM